MGNNCGKFLAKGNIEVTELTTLIFIHMYFYIVFCFGVHGICHADANRQVDSRANSPIIRMQQQR